MFCFPRKRFLCKWKIRITEDHLGLTLKYQYLDLLRNFTFAIISDSKDHISLKRFAFCFFDPWICKLVKRQNKCHKNCSYTLKATENKILFFCFSILSKAILKNTHLWFFLISKAKKQLTLGRISFFQSIPSPHFDVHCN